MSVVNAEHAQYVVEKQNRTKHNVNRVPCLCERQSASVETTVTMATNCLWISSTLQCCLRNNWVERSVQVCVAFFAFDEWALQSCVANRIARSLLNCIFDDRLLLEVRTARHQSFMRKRAVRELFILLARGNLANSSKLSSVAFFCKQRSLMDRKLELQLQPTRSCFALHYLVYI